MRLVQAHILRELLINAVLILLALLSLYFVLGLAFTLGSSRAQGAPMVAVLGSMSWQVVSNFGLTIPLTLLSASLFTYGRWSAEGEWTAARSAGIPPFAILTPALLVGALGAAGLAWSWNGLIPFAHEQKKLELRAGLLRNLETILTHGDRQIVERRWKADWQGFRQDAQGRLVLLDLVLLQLGDDGRVSVTYQAREAVCEVDARRLRLELRDLTREEVAHAPLRMQSTEITLDLDALSDRQFISTTDGSRSYDELWLRARRLRESARRSADRTTRRARLRRLLGHEDRQLVETRWQLAWEGTRREGVGDPVLLRPVVVQRDAEERVTATLRAREARCRIEGEQLVLALLEGTRQEPGEEAIPLGEGEGARVALDLDLLSERRAEDWRKEALEDARSAEVELHHRASVSLSAFLFAFLGAAIGLWKSVGHRAVVFLMGFLITVLTFYPLKQVGIQLAESGSLPAPAALAPSNLCLLLLSLHFFRKALRA